jgi:endo-1,4-beta-xylanase
VPEFIITHFIKGFFLRKLLLKTIVVLILSVPFLAAQTDTIQTNVPALKKVYSNDFNIGCLLSYRNIGFTTDPYVAGQSAVATPNGGYLIKFHMNSMTPGNNMKPQYTVSISASAAAYTAAKDSVVKDSINTHPIVAFNGDMTAQLNWAKRQGFTFRGHTLVWHSQTPTEFFRTGYTSAGAYLTKEKMKARLENYIKSIINLIHASWPSMFSAFDVVNEAIDDGTGKVRTSSNDWYAVFGDSTYIMEAFQLARKYTGQYNEKQIKLYYNDYNTHIAKKADGIVRLLTPIYNAGLLDGIGMQEHDADNSPTAADWIATYNKFYPICNEMSVTELDVSTNSGTNTPSAAVLATQANQYGMLFKCFVERSYKSGRGKIISVSKDGLNDAYTFVANQSTSLWDGKNQCKPSFFAAVNVGVNYNALDTLIKFADSLKQTEYTALSWSNFKSVLESSKTIKTQNYSPAVSADTSLGGAINRLTLAINSLVKGPSAVEAGNNEAPKVFSLGQNYPNPFNPATHIEYSIPRDGYVSLKVYNVLGQEVASLFEGFQKAGSFSVVFNGSKLSSGIYLYQLKAENITQTRKLILQK